MSKRTSIHLQSYSCFALGLLSCNEMLSCEASKRLMDLTAGCDGSPIPMMLWLLWIPWLCSVLGFFSWKMYHLVMTNSLPWKIPTINGGFLIYKWATFHGYVSHNQRVKKHTWSLSRHEHTPSLQANCGLSNSWWAKDQQGLKALVLYWG